MATLEYSGVVAAGPGWTQVQTPDGRSYTVQGDRAMRNNNPGNIEYGPYARSMGAIGTDGRFAVFPDRQAGIRAQSGLIFDSKSYSNLTLSQAISRYAPAFENNTTAYANAVATAAGVPLDTKMKDIPESKRGAVLAGMHAVEGNTSARVFDPVTGQHIGTIDGVSAPTPTNAPAPTRKSAFGPLSNPSPVRPDERNVAGPKGNFSVGGLGAPVGKVERGPALAPPSPSRPDNMAYAGPSFASPVRPDNAQFAGPKGNFSMAPVASNEAIKSAYKDYGFSRRMAPATPARSYEMRPPDPSLQAPSPPSTADLAAAYGQMADTMGQVGVQGVGSTFGSVALGTPPSAPVAPMQPAAPVHAMPTPVAQPVAAPVARPVRAPVQAPVQTMERLAPVSAHTPSDIYGGQIGSALASGGNTVSRDALGRTSVTNKHGVTTVSMPDGKQAAFGGPSIGAPSTPSSLFGGAGGMPSLGGMVKGGLGAMAGAQLGGLLGPVGMAVGGYVGSQLAQGKNPLGFLSKGTGKGLGYFPGAPAPSTKNWRDMPDVNFGGFGSGKQASRAEADRGGRGVTAGGVGLW